MRELRPEQRRSVGRELHRQRYATYMASPEWRSRRERWHSDELDLTAATAVNCRGCGRDWELTRDDLHHVDYSRLGDELHEDLWALCRSCHDRLHELIESSRSWRRLPRRLANEQALPHLQQELRNLEPGSEVSNLRDYL